MKATVTIVLIFLSISLFAQQPDFDKYFTNKTLRLDYSIGGNAKNTYTFFKQLKKEPFWGGSKKNLIDKFNFGDFRVLVFDKLGKKLLYSKGYSSLYPEWLDTDEAKKINRSFYESVTMPFPKNEVLVKIQMRNKHGDFKNIFSKKVSPNDYNIVQDKQTLYTTHKLHYSGDYNKKLDIVIIPDGYTRSEMYKFYNDCDRFIGYFFKVEPFKSNENLVNFWAVDAVSQESGTDIPGQGIWKNTVLNTHFYTFGIERYLTTEDIKSVRDIAAYVPYDQIYILVNTKKYGGGGIYNYYNLCMADNELSEQVFTHEFGHAFAALADEYEYGYEQASDIYDMTVEPWQVNITNLVDFSKKWKDLVKKGTPIPTPNTDKYKTKVGAFEGAGYVKKKMYRPTNDCKMRSNRTNDFCPVCYRTVLAMLKFYAE